MFRWRRYLRRRQDIHQRHQLLVLPGPGRVPHWHLHRLHLWRAQQAATIVDGLMD